MAPALDRSLLLIIIIAIFIYNLVNLGIVLAAVFLFLMWKKLLRDMVLIFFFFKGHA